MDEIDAQLYRKYGLDPLEIAFYRGEGTSDEVGLSIPFPYLYIRCAGVRTAEVRAPARRFLPVWSSREAPE